MLRKNEIICAKENSTIFCWQKNGEKLQFFCKKYYKLTLYYCFDASFVNLTYCDIVKSLSSVLSPD